MSFTAYPSEADLQAFLVNSGLASTAPEGITMYIEGAIEAWESATGYSPFLAESTDSTTYYDAPYPSRYLDLAGGYASITSLYYGISEDNDGVLGELGSNYFPRYLGPTIAGVEFSGLPSGAQSIKVVGKRGYSATVPAEVYRAILQKAAADYAPDVSQIGDVKRIRQGPIEYELNDSQTSKWLKGFDAMARKYRRL